MAAEGRDQRQFERHSLPFDIDIFDVVSDALIETAQLKDISGSGFCFLSARPDAYLVGQEISAAIHLPDTGAISAKMRGRGTVVWIASSSLSDGGLWPVGVDLVDPLQFHEEHKTGDAVSGEEQL